MVRRPTVSILLLALLVTPKVQAQSEHLLTMMDVSPELARLVGNTPLDFVASARITYGVTGQSSYDEFFRNSAVSYGGFYVGQQLTDNATINLKKYARSKAAVAEMHEEIATLTEGADTAQWTTAQSLAVLEAARKRDQLSAEEQSYMLATAINLAAAIPVVEGSARSATELTSTAPGLVSGARSSFGMLKAAGIARNVRQSADRVSLIPTQAPRLVESMAVLTHGLAMINGH